MSEIMFYFGQGGTETLEAFNARLAQFCSDNAIVDIDAKPAFKDGISVALTEADDMMFMLTRCVQPIVLMFRENQAATMEREISAYQQRLLEQRPESAVIRHVTVPAMDRVYVVLILHAYDIETEAVDETPPEGAPQ